MSELSIDSRVGLPVSPCAALAGAPHGLASDRRILLPPEQYQQIRAADPAELQQLAATLRVRRMDDEALALLLGAFPILPAPEIRRTRR